jgi:hypothetical protein
MSDKVFVLKTAFIRKVNIRDPRPVCKKGFAATGRVSSQDSLLVGWLLCDAGMVHDASHIYITYDI